MRVTAKKKILNAIIVLVLIGSMMQPSLITANASPYGTYDYSAAITPGERLDIDIHSLFYTDNNWGSCTLALSTYSGPQEDHGMYMTDGTKLNKGEKNMLRNSSLYFNGGVPGTYVIGIWFRAFPSVSAGISTITINVSNAVTTEASDITATEAVLNGVADADNSDMSVYFEYGTDTGYGYTVDAEPNMVTGTAAEGVSASISELVPNTTYHYRVVGQNDEDIYYGEDKTFKTLTALPTTTVGVESIAASGVTLNAIVNANNSDTTVTFEYGLDESYGSEISAQQNPVNGTEDTPVSAVIEGLEQNTTYHYRIKCENESGIVLSSDYTFETPFFATKPTASVTQKDCTIKKDAEITLSSEAEAEIYYTTAVNDGTLDIPSKDSSAYVTDGGAITLPELAPGDVLKIKAIAAVPGKIDSQVADISYNVQPQAALTLMGIAVGSKEYDGTAAAAADFTNLSLSGILESDSVEILGDPSAEFVTASAGDNKEAVINGYSLTGPDADYYYIDTTISTAASITKKELGIGTIVIADKQYDGSVSATAVSISLVGAIGSEEVYGDISLAEAVFVTDGEIGEDKPVSVSNIQLTGEDAGNYCLPSTEGTATGNIIPKTLSVSITIADRKFDGTTAATIIDALLVGIVGEDDVTVDCGAATAAFDNKSVGNNKPVTVTGLMLGGADKDKYTLSASYAAVGNITVIGKLPLPEVELTGDLLSMFPYINKGARVIIKCYDSLTYKDYPDATIYYETWGWGYNGGSPIPSPNTSSPSVISGGKIQVTGNDLYSFYIFAYAAQEGYEDSDIYTMRWSWILPESQLSVEGAGAANKDYDGTDTAIIYAGTLSGYIIPSASDARIDTNAVTGHFDDKNIGEDKRVTVSGYALTGVDAQFYELINIPTELNADIRAKEITVVNIEISDKVYDGTRAASISDITYSGKVGSDDVYVNTSEATAEFSDTDYGINKTVNVTGLKLGGTDAGNYMLTTTTASTTGNIYPTGTAAVPSVNLSADSLLSGTHIALSTITEGAIIYYTLDGSEPDIYSSVYTGPILITGNPGTVVMVKAIALKAGMVDSPVMTKQYTVAEPGSLIINAIPDNNEIKLSWTVVPGTGSYTVFDSQGNFLGNGTPGAEGIYEYTVSGLNNGTAYTYTVNAVDAEGRITNTSQASATPRTVPGMPANVKATAGEECATVTFLPPADNGGSPITGYLIKSEPESITVSGTDTSITVRGLTNGTAYTFTVSAMNVAGYGQESAASNPATPAKEESDSSGRSRGQSLSTPTNTNSGTAGNTGTGITTTEGGTTVTTFTGDMVRSMEGREAVLEVKTGDASYKLPAKEINISEISALLGTDVDLKDIKVQVEISKPTDDIVKLVEDATIKGNFTIIVPPIEFNVTCTYGDRTVSVSDFSSYVERTIAIPPGVDPDKITTGVVIEPDGTVRHVPTQIILIEGMYYAKINSLTNSTYSVIEHSIEFKDANGHWAKEVLNDMGSRMIISGTGNDLFEPDKDITRAEFTAILVRALGLNTGAKTNPYKDVKASDWYCGYIKTANEYKLISGCADEFSPLDRITREQAMVMLARAMNITGIGNTLEKDEAEKLLSRFIDSNEISGYARKETADCAKAGIVTGKSDRIAAKENITRAEAAVMIQRLLEKSNLIGKLPVH